MTRQSTASRPIYSASNARAAIARALTEIKEEDGLTDADLGAMLGKSEDQAAKYRTGLAEMGTHAFGLGKRNWNGRFTGYYDALCVDSRPGKIDDRKCHSTIIEAVLKLSVALEDGEITAEEVRANRGTLENAKSAIEDVLAKLAPVAA